LKNRVFRGDSIITFSISFFSSFGQKITIPIETQNISLVLQTDGKGKQLKIIHCGNKLKDISDYEVCRDVFNLQSEGALSNNNAFVVAGIDNNFVEPAIAAVHVDGNNSLDLRYENHVISKTSEGANLIKIVLKDPVYDFYVDLFFKAWENEDVIEQWSVIRHTEKGSVTLNKYASANLYFFNKKYYLTTYNSSWAKEMQPVQMQLKQGVHTIQSRLGTRENLLSSPNFMLSFDNVASENHGTVMVGQIAWNGNFCMEFEIDVYKNLHLVAGINPYQSSYKLEPGVNFETPRFIYTISFEGIGKASRNIQNWMRNHNLIDGKGDRLTLLNNWEATYFDFDQNKLVSLFDGAKELGVDMFLLDDGWFGNKYPRNDDKAGLGDWEVNRKKLPNGIPYLIKEANKRGLKFGIWIEPEMVNPKSVLYEKHIDWVLRQENRPEIYFRNQLVLDLTNPDVQDFVYNVVDQLFIENPELAFIKWDCNAPIFNGHSKYLEKNNIPQSHLYIEYTRGLEKVLKRIRKKYPKVPMMLCSGGGGRTDFSLFRFFTEFWLSDNTDPLERVFIQWNYSYYYPAITMCNHVTNWGNKPLKYRIDVASMGKLGFDIRVNELSDDDLALCKKSVDNYNQFKHIIWQGDLFRLINPYKDDFASLMFVNPTKTEGVMFTYLTNWRYVADTSVRPVKLQGLDPDKKYRITEINLYSNQHSPIDSGKIYSGDFLLKIGINPVINLSRPSVVLKIQAL